MLSDDLLTDATRLHDLLWERTGDDLRGSVTDFVAALPAGPTSLAAVLEELSDETLVLAIQKEALVAEAFTALMVTRYGPYLARWLYRWGTEANRAHDVIQDLYVRFYERAFATFRPDEQTFRAYLYLAARRLWIEKVCRPRKVDPLESSPEPPDSGPAPEQSLMTEEATARLEQALERLPVPERAVLRETMEEKTPAEVAESLGLEVKRVYRLLFNGRRKLEQLLACEAAGAANRPISGRVPRPRQEQETYHVGTSLGK